jgi:hypothetical protein
MGEARRGYLSYLLRLWQARADGELIWRASLESPHTGERLSFADAETLFAFLDAQTREFAPQGTAPPDGDEDQ